MPRRVRLIVYDGDEAWIADQKVRDLQTPYHVAKKGVIYSIDLEDAELTLFQCYVAEAMEGNQ